MAAARRNDDEAQEKRNYTTKEEDTTAAGYHQGTTEMKTEGGWGFPFAMRRMIPRNTMMASAERNTETGTETKAAREERWSTSWRHEANLRGTIYHRSQPSFLELGKTKDVEEEPTLVLGRKCQGMRKRRQME